MGATDADLAVLGGRVLVMDRAGTVAEALAVRDGRVVAVGGLAQVRELIGPRTEILDLDGGCALPGINDSHAHLAAWALFTEPGTIDLTRADRRSIAAVATAVGAAAAKAPTDDWITGFGWDLGLLEECVRDPHRMPARGDLDAVAPHHPVALTDLSGHSIWANSEALSRAGIDARAARRGIAAEGVLTGGDGLPTGILAEFAAQSLLTRHMPQPSVAGRRRAIAAGARRLHRLGVTSITDPAVGRAGGAGAMGEATLQAYRELAAAGELELRANLLVFAGEEGEVSARLFREQLAELRPEGDRRLRVAGVKIFADGVPPLHTAWLNEPYADQPTRGALAVPGASDEERVAELAAMVEVAQAAGWQVGVHATGDATIAATVAAMVAAGERHPDGEHRHHVIHGDLVERDTLATMSRHGIGLNIQPETKTLVADQSDALLGEERSAWQWPVASALDAGVHVAFSSDLPFSGSPEWLVGVAAAMSRQAQGSGKVSGPEQRIALTPALAAYTREGAWQDRAESWKGTLEPGMAADLCLLDADLTELEPQEIPAVGVLATVLDGRVVHHRG
jgi:predicted amidohydrolase YtcJ